MSRKEGIIHLGKSKSPDRFRHTIQHTRVQSIRTSRQKEPLRQTEILNNSMQITPQPNFAKLQIPVHSSTSPNFFQQPARNIEQVVIKENKSPNRTTIIHNSPLKRVIVSRPLSIHGEEAIRNQASHVIVQQPNADQLLRKIKVLEGRVQELHQQKQVCIVKSHEQNKRLLDDNVNLKAKLSEIDLIKNQEINNLKQQVNFLRNLANSQRVAQLEASQKSITHSNQPKIQLVESCLPLGSSLRNAAYIEDDQEKASLPKINHGHQCEDKNSSQLMNTEVVNQNWILQQQIERLSVESQKLKAEMQDIKQSFAQNTGAIESNNRQIVENYQSKIAYLEEELKNARSNQQGQNKFEQEVKFYKGQVDEYVQRNLQKCQQLMRVEDTYKKRISELQQNMKQARQNQEVALQKAKLLQLLISQTKPSIQPSSSAQTQTQQQKLTDSCQKCKQLVKTLVKLNQKSFGKTN